MRQIVGCPSVGAVSYTHLDVYKRQAQVRYRFTISDTGIGMTEAFTAHLFEPFTRSESAANVEGTGLGLSITKGLVDLMDGTISVESRIHQGLSLIHI